MHITAGKKVFVEYTLTLGNKEVFDTNVGSEPLAYVQGSDQMIPGLEAAMEGMKVGDSKHVKIKPEDGYGPVLREAIVEVAKDQLAPDARNVGARIEGRGPSGQILTGQVQKIKDDKVVVDFNHPLAGETIFFQVKVVDIQ